MSIVKLYFALYNNSGVLYDSLPFMEFNGESRLTYSETIHHFMYIIIVNIIFVCIRTFEGLNVEF